MKSLRNFLVVSVVFGAACAALWFGSEHEPHRHQLPLVVVSPALAEVTTTGGYVSTGAGQYGLAIDSATGLTVPVGTSVAEICVENQAMRYRDDGTAPTASVGIPVTVNTCFQYAGPLNKVKFISQTAGATLDISYYKSSG
jgi:hypothetical protein